MLGSSASVSDCNTVLNTIVAEELSEFADVLENAGDFESALHDLIVKTIREHKRIIFNGNGYDDAWTAEAENRGLLNLKTTPDAIPRLLAEKNIALFCKHKVFSERELHARYEIMLESYSKVINIEALTMVDMVNRDILPALSAYGEKLGKTIAKKTAAANVKCLYETKTLEKISAYTDVIYEGVQLLEDAIASVKGISDSYETAKAFESDVIPKMQALRATVDSAECITSSEFWPYPTYGDLLFGVR